MSAQKTTYSPKNTDFAADYANHREEVNHLGNVLAVVSDRKIAIEDGGNPGTVEYYEADIVSAQDYYPFGMIMPGRSVSAGEYRYGLHGMEKDDDLKDDGNHYTTFYRQYDPRIGTWWTLDPKMDKFASLSPYNFNFNNPLYFIDPEGDEPGMQEFFTGIPDHENIPNNPELALDNSNDYTDKSLSFPLPDIGGIVTWSPGGGSGSYQRKTDGPIWGSINLGDEDNPINILLIRPRGKKGKDFDPVDGLDGSTGAAGKALEESSQDHEKSDDNSKTTFDTVRERVSDGVSTHWRTVIFEDGEPDDTLYYGPEPEKK